MEFLSPETDFSFLSKIINVLIFLRRQRSDIIFAYTYIKTICLLWSSVVFFCWDLTTKIVFDFLFDTFKSYKCLPGRTIQ